MPLLAKVEQSFRMGVIRNFWIWHGEAWIVGYVLQSSSADRAESRLGL
jgi:hypothetical protein